MDASIIEDVLVVAEWENPPSCRSSNQVIYLLVLYPSEIIDGRLKEVELVVRSRPRKQTAGGDKGWDTPRLEPDGMLLRTRKRLRVRVIYRSHHERYLDLSVQTPNGFDHGAQDPYPVVLYTGEKYNGETTEFPTVPVSRWKEFRHELVWTSWYSRPADYSTPRSSQQGEKNKRRLMSLLGD